MVLTVNQNWMDCIILLMAILFMVSWIRALALGAGEGVNVQVISLPEGYFIKVKHTPWMAYVGIVFAALAVIVAFLLWFVFGRDDQVVETVEFYPPDGLNSVELAFAYRGYASSKDVVSMIVDLAQKGYIEISSGTK